MDNSPQAIDFLRFWFSHPAAPDKIRLIYLPSKYQAERFGVAGKVKEQWLEKARLDIEPDAAQEDLRTINLRGYDIFYFCNVVRPDCSGNANNKDITRRLFLPLDIDYRLPMSVEEVESELGLRFAAVVKTSEREFPHYQLLLGINTDEDETDLAALARRFCSLVGSDPIGDAKRILRLPGLVNWKGMTSEGGESRASLVRRDIRDVYGLPDACDAMARAGANGNFAQLAALKVAGGALGTVRSGGVSVGNGNGKGHFPRWDRALELAERGEISAGKGQRHNALLVWGGQMSSDGLSLENVIGNLDVLAAKACETSYLNDEEAARDYSKLRSAVRIKWAEIASELNEINIESGIEEAEWRDAPDSGVTPGAERKSEEKVTPVTRALTYNLLEFASRIAKQMQGETDAHYENFLGECLAGANFFFQKNVGDINQLANAVCSRLEWCACLTGGAFCCPVLTNIGKFFLSSRSLGEGEARNFVRQILFEVSAQIQKPNINKRICASVPMITALKKHPRRASSEENDMKKKKQGLKKMFAAQGELMAQFEREMILRRAVETAIIDAESIYSFQGGFINGGPEGADQEGEEDGRAD